MVQIFTMLGRGTLSLTALQTSAEELDKGTEDVGSEEHEVESNLTWSSTLLSSKRTSFMLSQVSACHSRLSSRASAYGVSCMMKRK
jgi:hypothetical protein